MQRFGRTLYGISCLLLVACGAGAVPPVSTPVSQLPPTRAPLAATAVPPVATPTFAPTPTTLTLALDWVGYAAYRVQPGDTLTSISQRGGNLPLLLSRYNRLTGEPPPGRALIVPQLPNTTSTLVSEQILVTKGSTSQPWVALTLDAGGSSEPTPRMLDALAVAKVTLTFFLTGTWMEQNPDLTRRIVADGHEIANHSYTHSDFTTLSDEEIAAELMRTEATLARIVGPEVSIRPFFRPPFGAYDDRVLQVIIANGYLPIYWTFDSLDSVGEPKTAEFLTARITTHLPRNEMSGAIILAHCGSAATAEALPTVLATFAAQGIEVRKLSEVLGP